MDKNFYYFIVIIFIILFIIIVLYIFRSKSRNYSQRSLFIKSLYDNDVFFTNLTNNLKTMILDNYEYDTTQLNYGNILSKNNKKFISTSILLRSHDDYQIGFKVRRLLNDKIKISIIEYNGLTPIYRVIYGDKLEYLNNYTVLNNKLFRIILKVLDDTITYDNILDLIYFIPIKINMRTNNLTDIVDNKYHLINDYFQYGDVCDTNLLYNNEVNNIKLLNNMLLPHPFGVNEELTKKLKIYINTSDVIKRNHIKLYYFNSNFNLEKSLSNLTCEYTNSEKLINNRYYIYLCLYNDSYNLFNVYDNPISKLINFQII